VHGAHELLAGELGGAVDAGGPRRVELPVGPAQTTVEDVLGADLHQVGPGARRAEGDVARAQGVDAEGGLGVGLAAVDVGEGGGVDHQVRRQGHDAVHRVQRGDVGLGAAEAQHGGMRRGAAGQRLAELPAGTGDENAHRAPAGARGPRMEPRPAPRRTCAESYHSAPRSSP
jgi:hypothetical protein